MSSSQTYELPDNLTIATVEALHEELEKLVSSGKDVVFDSAKVQRCDTAGLQTLLAFCLGMEKHNHTVAWDNITEQLTDVAALLGLQEALGLK